MDAHKEVSQKIKEMTENNSHREEAAKEADKRMQKGIVSEPVVEQVMPKPKKSKTVSVQRRPERTDHPTGDMEKELNPPKEEEKKSKKNLSTSLDEMEKLMGESAGIHPSEKAEMTTEAPATIKEDVKGPGVEKEVPAETRGSEPGAAKKDVRTTVKENPRHKGLHSIQRRRTNLQRSEARYETAEKDAYCLYEPLTGTLNELIRDVTIIGKSPQANIVINNRFVSRTHARVSRIGSDWYIEDLGSLNGTKVNGEPVKRGERVKLHTGDNIILAATKIIFDLM